MGGGGRVERESATHVLHVRNKEEHTAVGGVRIFQSTNEKLSPSNAQKSRAFQTRNAPETIFAATRKRFASTVPIPTSTASCFLAGNAYLKGQNAKKVLGSVGEPPFRFGAQLSEGTVGKRGRHGSAAKVNLAEHARGRLADEKGSNAGGVALSADRHSSKIRLQRDYKRERRRKKK